jgi:hypothetical protein
MLPDREFITQDQVSYMSFDIVNSKKLLHQMACGDYFKKQAALFEKRSAISDNAAQEYKEINEAQTKKINFLQDDRSRVVDMWKEENKKRHLAENKSSYGWTVALILAVTSLSFGTAFVLK